MPGPAAEKIFRDLLNRHPSLRPCADDIAAAFRLLLDCGRRRGLILACGNGGSSADADHLVGELMKGFLLPRPLGEEARRMLEGPLPPGRGRAPLRETGGPAVHPIPCGTADRPGGRRALEGSDSRKGSGGGTEDRDGRYLAEVLQEAVPAVSLSSHGALLTAFANDRASDAVFAQQVYGYGRKGDLLVCFSTSGNSRNVVLAARTARSLGLSVLGLTGRDGGALAPLCDAAVRVPETETFLIQELHLPVYHALAAALEAELFSRGESR